MSNIDDEIIRTLTLNLLSEYQQLETPANPDLLKLHIEAFEDKISQLITDARTETEKAYGGCRKCYGKGYATVRKGEETMNRHYKYLNTPVRNQVNFCSCNRGKQLYEVFGYPQTKELKENKR